MDCVEQTKVLIITTPPVTQPTDFLSNKNVELSIFTSSSPNDLVPKYRMRDERFMSLETCIETFQTLISEVTTSECFENWFECTQKYMDLKGENIKKQ